jgi:hypothetical protein
MRRRSKRKLKPSDAHRFVEQEPRLFAELAAVVCSTGAIPRKELHECWHMAARVHDAFPDVTRVADLAAGHGLLAWILVLLAHHAERPVVRTAVAVDLTRPRSAATLAAAMRARWPALADAVPYVEGGIDAVTASPGIDTLFVAAHACGGLSDRVLLAAVGCGSAVAVMPCCHSLRKQGETLAAVARTVGLSAQRVREVVVDAHELGQPAAIDALRIEALAAAGYDVRQAAIDPEITTYNRIILARPTAAVTARSPRTSTLAAGVDPHAVGDIDSLAPRGESLASKRLASLDVTDADAARQLARRPSRTWRRSVDLSFWVDDDVAAVALSRTLAALVARFVGTSRDELAPTVALTDRYTDEASRRCARTYRITLASCTREITRADATDLLRQLRGALVREPPAAARLRG